MFYNAVVRRVGCEIASFGPSAGIVSKALSKIHQNLRLGRS